MISSRFKPTRRSLRFVRPAVGVGLAALTIAILRVSWLRWMDPFVDFGREVYMPWRILAGEHPGRDFVHLYGPFSAYFNAGLFATFGVAIRTLVGANLVIFAGIAAGLFVVTRRAFGFLPAAVAVAVAIPVFGFAHYGGINNYTYAAPYAHEATHGMFFLLLALVCLGDRRAFALRPGSGLVAGLLFGLCCLTKTEYVLVAAILWTACLARLVLTPTLRPRAGPWVAWNGVGAALVFGIAWVALLTALPASEAARSVFNAFLAPFSFRGLSHSTLGLRLLGADRLGENLQALALVGAAALAALALVAWLARRSGSAGAGAQWALLALVGGSAVAAILTVPWLLAGTAFPGLLLGGMAWLRFRRSDLSQTGARGSLRSWNQWLFFLAAGGMLARMIFDPTVNHYGFFQALLAGTWVMGFLVGEWPRVGGNTRLLRLGLAGAVVVVLAGGANALWQRSLEYYRKKETPIGDGGDRILGYRPEVYGLPQAWSQVSAHLAARTPPTSTLLVIPEGISLNYWTRRKHPLRILDLLPATLALNGRDVLLDLSASPPDTVVLVSRDMTEFGYRAYGEDERSGKPILEWLGRNYTIEIQAGDYPFTPERVGLWVLRRKTP